MNETATAKDTSKRQQVDGVRPSFVMPTRSEASWLAIGLLTLVAAVFVLGLGATLLLTGAWVLAVGLSRTIPRISVPASWAFAAVCEATIVLSLSGLCSLISRREQPPAVNIAILAAPILVGAVLAITASRRRRGRPAHGPFFDRIAILVAAIAVAAAGVLGARGASFGIAWAMSGDARNHLMIMRASIFNGGITVDQVRAYPAALNAIAGIISGSTSRAGLPSGELLLHDTRALAATYVLLGITVACMIVAAIAAFIPAKQPLRGAASVAATLVLLVAAGAAVSPLLLGTALVDGSFSAYGGLAIALASIVIALSALQDDELSVVKYVFLAPASLILFVTWTLLAVVSVGLIVVLAIGHLIWSVRHRGTTPRSGQRVLRAVLFGLPIVCVLVIAGAILINLHRLDEAFRFSGSINPVNVWLLPILASLLVVTAITAPPPHRRFAIAGLGVIALSIGVVLWLMHLPHGWRDLTPSYYSQKTLWLVVSAFVWVPFMPVLRLFTKEESSSAKGRNAVAAGLASLTILVTLSAMTTVPEPISQAVEGWSQPSAEVITRVAQEADVRPSFVLWNYAAAGDDRLGNFWSALAWTTTTSGSYKVSPSDIPGGFAYWAYFESGQIDQLCKLVTAYPRITVVTSSLDTRTQLVASCGSGQYDIDLVAPPSP